MPKTVAIVGTLDTKGEEFAYLRSRIESAGLATLVIDCGVLEAPAFTSDISRGEVATAAGQKLEDLLAARDRGSSIAAMAEGAAVVVRRLFEEGRIQGLSLGGSGLIRNKPITPWEALPALPLGPRRCGRYPQASRN